MAPCWVDPMHVDGSRDHVLCVRFKFMLFAEGRGPHLLSNVKQTEHFFDRVRYILSRTHE